MVQVQKSIPSFFMKKIVVFFFFFRGKSNDTFPYFETLPCVLCIQLYNILFGNIFFLKQYAFCIYRYSKSLSRNNSQFLFYLTWKCISFEFRIQPVLCCDYIQLKMELNREIFSSRSSHFSLYTSMTLPAFT